MGSAILKETLELLVEKKLNVDDQVSPRAFAYLNDPENFAKVALIVDGFGYDIAHTPMKTGFYLLSRQDSNSDFYWESRVLDHSRRFLPFVEFLDFCLDISIERLSAGTVIELTEIVRPVDKSEKSKETLRLLCERFKVGASITVVYKKLEALFKHMVDLGYMVSDSKFTVFTFTSRIENLLEEIQLIKEHRNIEDRFEEIDAAMLKNSSNANMSLFEE